MGDVAIGGREVVVIAGPCAVESEKQLDIIAAGVSRYGARILVVNRFLPGIRAFFLFLAGMRRLPLGQSLLYGTLSNLGLFSRFVGMTTDSRSFLSYSRHEYFRRLLCDVIGRDVVNGELPHDMKLLSALVRDICYRNAAAYFPLEPGKV
jgi:membrane protein DedA with SNARE-associated domain